jgi:hypothetical protein
MDVEPENKTIMVQSYDVTPFLKFKGMQECCAFFGHCDQNT